jgi:hypothetical protein
MQRFYYPSMYIKGEENQKKYQCNAAGTQFVHKITWINHWGKIPEGYEIDHIDHDPFNNDIFNLRLVTQQQNTLNVLPKGGVKYKGVTYEKSRDKYQVRFHINGGKRKSKRFNTAKEAAEQYNKWVMELPKEILYEHDLLGNDPTRIVPYLNEF